jgi:hypothetical protein
MAKQSGSVLDKSDFDKATEDEGLAADSRERLPFLPLTDKKGNWVTGEVGEGRAVSYVPKKGKNKGKKVNTTYYPITVLKSGIAGVGAGDKLTISPTGLLAFQLSKGMEERSLEFPIVLGIKYNGMDDEGRHNTEVRYPGDKK